MKFIKNLSKISGGNSSLSVEASGSSQIIASYAPGPINGLGYTAHNYGKTFFGDDFVVISGIPLIIAEENRSWSTVFIAVGSGVSLGMIGGLAVGASCYYLYQGRAFR